MNNKPTVTSVKFESDPMRYNADLAVMTMSDGSVNRMSFYSDEIQFSSEELIGKTEDEYLALYRQKDIAWLQS